MSQLAGGQFGIVDIAELASVGIDKRGAWRRHRSGRLFRLHNGVYSVVPPRLLRAEGHWLAAVKAAGPGAVLSHGDAAALWDLTNPPSGRVHVSVPSTAGRRRRRDLVVHRCQSLSAKDVTRRNGIPVTTVARTLRDAKRTMSRARLEAMLERAERLRLDTGWFFDGADVESTKLERRLLALCRRHRVPAPRTQQVIGPYTVDFLWPEAGLIVETDGWTTHGTRSKFEADRNRDAWLATRGYRVIRFTWRQLRDDRATVIATLTALLNIER